LEVHHHPHVEKKRFKEYVLEGLMIFFAVSMGFFAENFREHITENQREKEFAKTLYTELSDDSASAATSVSRRLYKEKDLDYLYEFFKDSSLTNLPKSFYPSYIKGLYLINTYAFEPKDGILSQLRNSGSLRYFKSIALQKLLGDLSVCINNLRTRNDQEYQFFSSPIKPFLLRHCDFKWLDQLRNNDTKQAVLEVINEYDSGSVVIRAEILNINELDRTEARNMVMFYKQMVFSTRSLQLKNYITTNHQILELLRDLYSLQKD